MSPLYFGSGGLQPRPVIEIPMATPPSAAAATQVLVKAATAAPPKGKTSDTVADCSPKYYLE